MCVFPRGILCPHARDGPRAQTATGSTTDALDGGCETPTRNTEAPVSETNESVLRGVRTDRQSIKIAVVNGPENIDIRRKALALDC
jgi:hypothetical protein